MEKFRLRVLDLVNPVGPPVYLVLIIICLVVMIAVTVSRQ
jgi:hypothetical protein